MTWFSDQFWTKYRTSREPNDYKRRGAHGWQFATGISLQ